MRGAGRVLEKLLEGREAYSGPATVPREKQERLARHSHAHNCPIPGRPKLVAQLDECRLHRAGRRRKSHFVRQSGKLKMLHTKILVTDALLQLRH